MHSYTKSWNLTDVSSTKWKGQIGMHDAVSEVAF